MAFGYRLFETFGEESTFVTCQFSSVKVLVGLPVIEARRHMFKSNMVGLELAHDVDFDAVCDNNVMHDGAVGKAN